MGYGGALVPSNRSKPGFLFIWREHLRDRERCAAAWPLREGRYPWDSFSMIAMITTNITRIAVSRMNLATLFLGPQR